MSSQVYMQVLRLQSPDCVVISDPQWTYSWSSHKKSHFAIIRDIVNSPPLTLLRPKTAQHTFASLHHLSFIYWPGTLTHQSLWDVTIIFSNFQTYIKERFPVKMPAGECYKTPLYDWSTKFKAFISVYKCGNHKLWMVSKRKCIWNMIRWQ